MVAVALRLAGVGRHTRTYVRGSRALARTWVRVTLGLGTLVAVGVVSGFLAARAVASSLPAHW